MRALLAGSVLVILASGGCARGYDALLDGLPSATCADECRTSPASREFTKRLRALFPAGTPTDRVIATLRRHGFADSYSRGRETSVSTHHGDDWVCNHDFDVTWTTNPRGLLTTVSGSEGLTCL